MIIYHPFEGRISSDPVTFTPKSCFVMTQLGKDICPKNVDDREKRESYS